MNLLDQFTNYLNGQKNKPSFLTVKNYKADVGQFINWFEKKFKLSFDPSKVTPQILDLYKKTRNLSPVSIGRHISSLRKFFSFLKTHDVISFDPSPVKLKEEKIEPDPWMLKNFKSFLYEYKKSNLTIKNYINDIKSFFSWLTEVSLSKSAWDVTERNLLDKINFSIIDEYKNRLIKAAFSPRTINRKLSSLRSYIAWAKQAGLISEHSENSVSQNLRKSDTSDNQTHRNIEDSESSEKKYSSFPPIRLVQRIVRGADLLFDNIFILPLAKIIEATLYLSWKLSGKKIFTKAKIEAKVPISNIRKEFYAPMDVSLRFLPVHKKAWHYLRHARPDWYKKYHSYSITHYFHFAILFILASAVGFGVYNTILRDYQKENAILGAVAGSSPRILSFQGKLTDSSDNPIASSTNILFSLYNDKGALEKDFLWQETNFVKPGPDGSFSLLLGKNNPIPDILFKENPMLFLGIKVGESPELTPRERIATVLFASDSQTLQGLEPITYANKVSNVVLALDSGGNLSIAGSRPHTFQTIGGQFVLSGSILTLTTVPGSNSNVEIMPDGTGIIDLLKPIQNSSNNNNLSGVTGAVEFDDIVAILATSSAQSAFNINQNSIGPLISASTSGIAKFVVDNDGTGTFAGDVGINGADLTSSSTSFNLLNTGVTTLNIGGASSLINIGISGGTMNIKSNLIISKDLTLSSFTSNGGILYTNGSGKISQSGAGSTSDCLIGGSSPTFTPCANLFDDIPDASISGNLTVGGNVGIGTASPTFKLDIRDSQASTATAQIYNTNSGTDADGLIVKLGNTSTTAVNSNNHFVSFETAGIGIVGSIQGNGGKGITYATSGVADFAEYFRKDEALTIEFGSVVCLNDNGLAVLCDENNGRILGIASERPAFLGGENLGNKSITVGLIGQVDAFVSLSNGAIKPGDPLSASDIPGVAVKTAKAGQIVGKALENLAAIDESEVVGYYDPANKEYRSKASFPDIPLKSDIIKIVKINAFVNVSWYDPGAYLANNGDLIVNNTGSNGYSISNSKNEILTNIGGYLEVKAANIKAGLISASEVVTNSLVVASDTIIINGQNLKDYIARVVNELGIKNQESGIVSPVINTNRLSANIISPLGESLIVRLATPSAQTDSSFIIQNVTGSAVAIIDNQGNASFSGQLLTSQLTTNDATVSGTLRANRILVDSIEGLERFMDIASYSGQFAYVEGLQAEHAQFNQGLMVFGSTSLLDLSIADQLSIGGTMFVTENSIETLGTDLSLQSLRLGGLSIMGGLVYVDTDGNLKVKGDVSVSGNLAVLGDIVASGSGTFLKLNFSLIQPVLAVSATEVIASASAGATSINPNQREVTIRNALVTDKSVIYITPVGTPSAQTPFLMRQIPSESFTVGVEKPATQEAQFNWLIVN